MNKDAPLKIILAAPRGFCAGVDRAIKIVERAIDHYGAPVYVRHEIVHNQRVVETLEKQGAVFVDEVSDVPENAPVIFSAHGVAKSVPMAAQARGLTWLDATCPLVSKVHIEASRLAETDHHILLIGHAGHPEVIGTMGQVETNKISLIETKEDARNFSIEQNTPLAYVTQTTLSVDDTSEIIDVLVSRFPNIVAPHKEDICYATTNRQQAVKNIAPKVDQMLVIGATNSSNSVRLVEVALKAGCEDAQLIADADDIDWDAFSSTVAAGVKTLGITAGASAPEAIVREVVESFKQRFDVELEEYVDTVETVKFNLPRELRD
ncbi:4-hydroxy-3-methylbut-2-enyl diphosphate reductase [Alphaproteobacteria bacterium]|nr:4-hydroxy-3-methylbut-2-enyl diphosphate reductase [Alphaproteobacteria bacterium]